MHRAHGGRKVFCLGEVERRWTIRKTRTSSLRDMRPVLRGHLGVDGAGAGPRNEININHKFTYKPTDTQWTLLFPSDAGNFPCPEESGHRTANGRSASKEDTEIGVTTKDGPLPVLMDSPV